MGVGFAVPVDTVSRIVAQLIAFGKVTAPSLGAQLASDSVAKQLRVTDGALVQSLVPGGAAEKAGLLAIRRDLAGIVPGDAIVAIDGAAVKSALDVRRILDGRSVGDRVVLRVRREGSELEITATLQSDGE